MSVGDYALRQIMIDQCYVPADRNQSLANACDILEKDSLELLWNDLDFSKLVDYNQHKYVFEYANMPQEIFNRINNHLKHLHDLFEELIEEIDSHKDVAIVKIKEFIDNKTKELVMEARINHNMNLPKLRTEKIEVTETIDDPNSYLTNVNFPNAVDFGNGESLFSDFPFKKKKIQLKHAKNKRRVLIKQRNLKQEKPRV